jgi:hypothetical protein
LLIQQSLTWAGLVTCREEKRNARRILVGHLKARDCWEDLSVDLQITLQRISKKWDGVEWIHLVFDKDKRPVLVNTVINI